MEEPTAMPYRLLQPTLPANPVRGPGENRKPTEKIHKENTRGENDVILGETETPKDELATEEIREVQNNLHVEDPGGQGSKLWS